MQASARAAALAARSSYGRLIAILSARTRDIAAAEDALADAFVSALKSWPSAGVPDNPDAWLLTVARNGLKNRTRHRAVVDALARDLALLQEEAGSDEPFFPDDRLKLLFVCAHPAIDEAVRTPLMLQTVLGMDAAQIAAAFLVAPSTMGQRLVRAKAKIKLAALRFELPTVDDMPERLEDVLNAIYAAFNSSWEGVAGAEAGARDLAEEAIFLSRLLVNSMPDQPEALGLLALELHCHARRPARRSAAGAFVPLKAQDARLWSHEMIAEAEALLTRASRAGVFGRFQCEAAIQSVHAQRAITGRTDHEALALLYGLLAKHCPSIGVLVSQAAAALEAGQAAQALALLHTMAPAQVKSYQPYWVTLAKARAQSGDFLQANQAMRTAVGLTEDSAVRHYLTTAPWFDGSRS